MGDAPCDGPEVEFDWDKANIAHVRRHSVTPTEAEQVIMNDPVESELYCIEGEERVTSVGPTDAGVLARCEHDSKW